MTLEEVNDLSGQKKSRYCQWKTQMCGGSGDQPRRALPPHNKHGHGPFSWFPWCDVRSIAHYQVSWCSWTSSVMLTRREVQCQGAALQRLPPEGLGQVSLSLSNTRTTAHESIKPQQLSTFSRTDAGVDDLRLW